MTCDRNVLLKIKAEMRKTKLLMIILLFVKERRTEDMLLCLSWRKMCKNMHRIETNAKSICGKRVMSTAEGKCY